MRALYFLPCAALSGYITMKIVIAPDSYKESLSATEVAQAIEKGFREIFPMRNMFLSRLPMAVKERSKP